MINFFDKLYNRNVEKNNILGRLRYYSLMRFVIRIAANLIIPIYFSLSRKNSQHKLIESKNNPKIIVSLTSFPVRINKIHLVIETILRQTNKPDKIILWLSRNQFVKLHKELPKSLTKLIDRGLEIRFVEGDIRSHKKYLYAMQEFSNDIIITIDDDVFYNTKILENLIKLNAAFPSCIICNHAHYIGKQGENVIQYSKWENVKIKTIPTNSILAIGVGGILYPPKCLYKDFNNIDLIMNLCPFADDIWLNVMENLNNTFIVKSSYNSMYLPVLNSKNITLNSKNINEEFNDKQIYKIRNYYIKNISRDPFNITYK